MFYVVGRFGQKTEFCSHSHHNETLFKMKCFIFSLAIFSSVDLLNTHTCFIVRIDVLLVLPTIQELFPDN